jgi:hypothetical protein
MQHKEVMAVKGLTLLLLMAEAEVVVQGLLGAMEHHL